MRTTLLASALALLPAFAAVAACPSDEAVERLALGIVVDATIVEQKDFDNPVFKGSWGASDEDLMAKADETFRELHKQGKPFFSLVFSSSNHDPFEFPDNRIELFEQPKQTRNNAAKYADYAIGEFFKKARNSEYWKDTLFLVIADHDSRVSGARASASGSK